MNVGLKFWSLNLIKESQGMMILLDLCRLKEPKNMFSFLGSCETHCPFRPAVGKCQFSKITNSKHQSGPKKLPRFLVIQTPLQLYSVKSLFFLKGPMGRFWFWECFFGIYTSPRLTRNLEIPPNRKEETSTQTMDFWIPMLVFLGL